MNTTQGESHSHASSYELASARQLHEQTFGISWASNSPKGDGKGWWINGILNHDEREHQCIQYGAPKPGPCTRLEAAYTESIEPSHVPRRKNIKDKYPLLYNYRFWNTKKVPIELHGLLVYQRGKCLLHRKPCQKPPSLTLIMDQMSFCQSRGIVFSGF